MKRRERRIDWRSKPAKQTIKEDPTIASRIILMDAMGFGWLWSGEKLSKEELDRIDETIIGSVPIHYSAAVLGRMRTHSFGSRLMPSDVSMARTKFLFRETGVKVEE